VRVLPQLQCEERVKTRDPQFAGAGLYAEDFAIWTARTAELLRARRFADVDIEHVAEEIEDRAKVKSANCGVV
jgi:hypothetical protein